MQVLELSIEDADEDRSIAIKVNASITGEREVALTPDLNFRRRVLVVLYRKYLDADLAWVLAQREVLSWFPLGARPAGSLMGNRGSHLRRLCERRDRALSQFMGGLW
jgi:hypothetical protein